jgi:SAM-dependent methyltransferase
MFDGFAQRSHRLERLDTGDYTADEYVRWQGEMKWINRLLGDTRALRLSLADELRDGSANKVSVLDVGAGAGYLLKAAVEITRENGGLFVGAELNHEAALTLDALSGEFGISGVQCDALRLPFADDSFDFAISSLFLHHLDDEQAVTLINEMNRVARKRFIIIDLHRHPVAYYLFRGLGRLFLQRFTVEDGALSILKSFRPAELKRLAHRARVQDAVVKRQFAFRLLLSGGKAVPV